MKLLLNLLVLAPLVVCAQGIHFENGMSWEQIKGKAKAENKYIFVDCYASWCGPCKKMDQDVYTKDSVGDILNLHFISVKVQMDTSKKDNDTIKAWYTDAHALMTSNGVNAFPTYLFFSPAGQLVHRGLGYQQPRDFVQLAINAVDPKKQYYVLTAQYRSGAREYAMMPTLANEARSFNEKALADSIAAEYLHNYLDKLTEEDICSKTNLEFIAGFAKVLTSNDKVFKCIYSYPALADTAMHDKGFAKGFINYMVTKEEITPVTARAKKEGMEPDWPKIGENIKGKYGAGWVEENVVNAKIGWYRAEKDWKNYTKCLVGRMDIIGLQNIPNDFWSRLNMNNSAWDIFLYSDNKEELEKAVTWSDWVIERDPQALGAYLDTKANLLYKLGKKEAALALETKAVQTDPKNRDFSTNLEKMQHGEPTWVATN